MPFLIYDPGAGAPGFMLSPASRALPVNFASTPNPILNLKNISNYINSSCDKDQTDGNASAARWCCPIMRDMLLRALTNLAARVGGPMTFRIILQPLMASLFAFRDGLRDAREGRPPYLWTLITDSSQRADLLRQGWVAVGRVFILAIVMDVVYQLIVGGWIYPGELLTIAILLAVVPYLVIRGPVNRLVRSLKRKSCKNPVNPV